jgi:hypothetical protein
MQPTLTSKVLVLDDDSTQADALKTVFEVHGLTPLKVRRNRLMSVLRTNIDLGGIFISETYGASSQESAEIALRIQALRPELPIVLRRANTPADSGDLPESWQRAVCAVFDEVAPEPLKAIIDEHIFSLYYPCELVRGISELTESVLAGQFPALTLHWETPCLVRDQIIFGEVFSLIPLESDWCRGYMMLQTEEQPIIDTLNRHAPRDGGATFRTVNNLLGETTNLIWGAFKNRYIGDAASAGRHVQVPLIVNHKQRYISFGSDNPQLCFLYTLTDDSGASIRIYQRFVFNLAWSPEDFREIVNDPAALVEAGELEFF